MYGILDSSLSDYVGVKGGYVFNKKSYILNNVDIGSTVDMTPISNNILDYIVLDCTYGDTFYITGQGASTARICAFVDADNKMVWKSASNANWVKQRVNTPSGATKIIINCKNNATYDLVMIAHDSPLYKSVLSSINITVNASNYSDLSITDADTITANATYGIASNITEAMIANLPDYGTSAMLYSITAITPAEATPSGIVTVQFYITTNALQYFYRTKAGSDWSPWFSVTNSDSYDLSSYFVNTCVQKPFVIDSTKRIILFGDSITTRTGSDDLSDPHYWLKDIATMTGCEWSTYGVGSSAFTDTGDPDQRGGQIITQIQSDSVNWDADIVIVAGGTNDAGFGYKLDETTVLNNLETDVQECIDTIKQKLEDVGRSDAKIVFITPIRRGGTTAKKVAIRAFLPKVCAKIANIALLNKISVINGFDFPITVETTEYYDAMTNYDELHPNNAGKWVYAMAVLNALL
jgi:lysophospholipase L1-like esterase